MNSANSVCVYVTISAGTPWAAASLPNTAEYCLRNGYSLVARNLPYAVALAESQREIVSLLSTHDLVFCIDADCLITNHTTRIDCIDGVGDHVTVCEEGMWWLPQNRINCGAMIYKATHDTVKFLLAVQQAEPEWRDTKRFPYATQSWIAANADFFKDALKIAAPRTFNSVAWEWHGGGTTWQPGDFVFHPCCHPPEKRLRILREKMSEVVR